MGGRYKRLVAPIATLFLLLGIVAVPDAVGEEAILIPGATVLKPINPVMPLFQYFYYPSIGNKFHDDDDPQVIDYPQEALAADWAIRVGVKQTIAAVTKTGGKVVVIGESMGSMVAARVAAELARSAEPPSTDDIRFVLFVPPEVGAAEYFKEGTYIPILNYRVRRLPESPYPTTILIGEYDFWSDPPDRPWNLVSLLNSALGIAFVHTFLSLSDPAEVPPENITVKRNSLGATVTTYFVPTENLPLTDIFRLVLPDALVDVLDAFLRPIVDAGYRRHDEPGDRRPYLSDGEIHWPSASEVAAPAGPTLTSSGEQAADETQTGIQKSGTAASTASTEPGRPSAPTPVASPDLAGDVNDDSDARAVPEADAGQTQSAAAVQHAPMDASDGAVDDDVVEAQSGDTAPAVTDSGEHEDPTPDRPATAADSSPVSEPNEDHVVGPAPSGLLTDVTAD